MFSRDFIYLGVSALQVVLVALMTPILTRRVGAYQFGQLTLAILVAQLLALTFSFGLPFAAQKVFAGDDGDRRSRGVLAISAVLAVTASLIAVFAAPAWGPAVGLDRVVDARLAAGWAACFALTLTALALLRSMERLWMAIFVAAVQSLGAQAAGVLLLFWWTPTVTSYLCGLIIGQGVAGLVGLLALSPDWLALAAIRRYGGTFVFGLPMVPQQLSGFILGLGDRVVVRHVLGSAAVGRYSVAYNLGNLGFILLVLVNQAWMPRIYAVSDREARSRLLASSRDLMNLLLIPVVCGLAAGAPLVLEVWVPPSFQPAQLTIIVAIIAICTFPFAQFVANLRALMSEGKTGRAAVATLIAAAVNIVLNVVMVPFLGITGSAIATVLSYALCARLTRPPVRSGLQVPGASGPLRSLIVAAVAVTLALGTLPASPVWLAVRVVIATVAVLAFALLLRRAMAGLEVSNALVKLVAVRQQPVPMPVTSAGAKVQTRNDPLAGTGLLQSQVEWAVRGRVLAGSLGALIRENLPGLGVSTGRGLDIGCQRGGLIDQVTEETHLSWEGIDPILGEVSFTEKGAPIGPGRADDIPYPDAHFDAVILANVFEHIAPHARQQSLDEICRVLKPGGILAGQIPNPYFPVESHSRLPFMGFLPVSVQRRYWRLSPVPWEHDFFVVTMRHLRRHAVAAGLRVTCTRPFNYPPDAIPARVRAVARIGAPIMRVLPWAWQFVLIKPNSGQA